MWLLSIVAVAISLTATPFLKPIVEDFGAHADAAQLHQIRTAVEEPLAHCMLTDEARADIQGWNDMICERKNS